MVDLTRFHVLFIQNLGFLALGDNDEFDRPNYFA